MAYGLICYNALMIKAIIMDVDGIIVGNQTGINFPLPPNDVIHALNNLRSGGMPVILCTARFNRAILDIIKLAGLNNPHITDGGALIINPIENKIIKKFTIEKNIVKDIISSCLKNDIYTELYTSGHYYIQNTQVSDFTEKRATFLQTKPDIVYSLSSIARVEEIIKIIPFAKDNVEISRAESVLKPFRHYINYFWSFLNTLKPFSACVITAPGVSKSHAAEITAEHLGLSFDTILGIGDSSSDWNFMELCKYVATLENGDEKIKTLIKTKGENNFYIGPHIDNNGFLDILKHFSLTT